MRTDLNILGIETSGEACSVAVLFEGNMHVFFEHAPLRHAERLLPAVQHLLHECGIQLEELDTIAFGRGPGSFTSLRIGIGVVQGLAWGAGLQVVPVSSLAAVAQLAVDSSSSDVTSVCVATDARMQEVYTANFDCRADGVVAISGAERVCRPSQVVVPRQRPFIAVGNGFDRFDEMGEWAALAAETKPGLEPRAEEVCKLALHWMNQNEALPAGMAQPVYVRNNVASKPGKS